jgi:hypothetical protein
VRTLLEVPAEAHDVAPHSAVAAMLRCIEALALNAGSHQRVLILKEAMRFVDDLSGVVRVVSD